MAWNGITQDDYEKQSSLGKGVDRRMAMSFGRTKASMEDPNSQWNNPSGYSRSGGKGGSGGSNKTKGD